MIMGHFALPENRLFANQLLGNRSYVMTLETSHSQFVLAGPATTVTSGNGAGSVRTSTAYLVQRRLPSLRVGQTHDDHSMMEQGDVGANDCGFLTTVLSGTGGEDTTDFAHKCILCPQAASLVKEIAHLGAHITKTGGNTKDDSVGIS